MEGWQQAVLLIFGTMLMGLVGYIFLGPQPSKDKEEEEVKPSAQPLPVFGANFTQEALKELKQARGGKKRGGAKAATKAKEPEPKAEEEEAAPEAEDEPEEAQEAPAPEPVVEVEETKPSTGKGKKKKGAAAAPAAPAAPVAPAAPAPAQKVVATPPSKRPAASAPPAAPTPPPVAELTAEQKAIQNEIRKNQKKLREITDLKAKRTSGEVLTQAQIAKVQGESALVEAIRQGEEALEAALSAPVEKEEVVEVEDTTPQESIGGSAGGSAGEIVQEVIAEDLHFPEEQEQEQEEEVVAEVEDFQPSTKAKKKKNRKARKQSQQDEDEEEEEEAEQEAAAPEEPAAEEVDEEPEEEEAQEEEAQEEEEEAEEAVEEAAEEVEDAEAAEEEEEEEAPEAEAEEEVAAAEEETGDDEQEESDEKEEAPAEEAAEAEAEAEAEAQAEGEAEAEAEAEEGEEGEEGEEEEEHFTPVDLDAACMLLGGVTFVMFLFQLVNVNDDDVRRYAWKVVSNTISIFMAVLFFQGNNQMLEMKAKEWGWSPAVMVLLEFIHCSFYVISMFAMVGYVTGVWEENVDLGKMEWVYADAMLCNFEEVVPEQKVRAVKQGVMDATKSVALDEQYGMEIAVVKKAVEHDKRWRQNKAWSTLLAHMGGFAAISAGGAMQHLETFKSNPLLAFLPVVITTIVLFVLFQMTGILRAKLKSDAKRTGRPGKRAIMVHEIISEAENDILALAISFNLIQVARFAIEGQLPDIEGRQEPPIPVTLTRAFLMFGCSLAFVGLSIGMAGVRTKIVESAEKAKEAAHAKSHPGEAHHGAEHGAAKEGEEAEDETMAERLTDIIMNAFAMCSAWCTLFGARAVWMLSGMNNTIEVTSIDGRILLAIMLSIGSFVVVYYLDKVDDAMRESPGAVNTSAEKAISSIVGAISVLVGFTWENSFDGAVAAVASLNSAHPQFTKFVLGIVVFGGLAIPWRRFILKRALQLEDLKMARDKALLIKSKQEVLQARAQAGTHRDDTRPLLQKRLPSP